MRILIDLAVHAKVLQSCPFTEWIEQNVMHLPCPPDHGSPSLLEIRQDIKILIDVFASSRLPCIYDALQALRLQRSDCVAITFLA